MPLFHSPGIAFLFRICRRMQRDRAAASGVSARNARCVLRRASGPCHGRMSARHRLWPDLRDVYSRLSPLEPPPRHQSSVHDIDLGSCRDDRQGLDIGGLWADGRRHVCSGMGIGSRSDKAQSAQRRSGDGTFTVPIAKREGEDMFKHVTQIATVVVLGLVFHGVADCQSRWEFREIYSTPDGSVQFTVLLFNGYTAELPVLTGQTLVASDGKTERPFTFANTVIHSFSDHVFD